jgi:hypothetical protein
LAKQLDDTIIVAAADIHRGCQNKTGQANKHEGQAGVAYHRTGGSDYPC